jgi:hypothetical protein
MPEGELRLLARPVLTMPKTRLRQHRAALETVLPGSVELCRQFAEHLALRPALIETSRRKWIGSIWLGQLIRLECNRDGPSFHQRTQLIQRSLPHDEVPLAFLLTPQTEVYQMERALPGPASQSNFYQRSRSALNESLLPEI